MRLILSSLLLVCVAHAADFSKADALFAQRENNLSVIHQARALYENILYHTGDRVEQLNAMDQLGRLAYYEGELLTPMEDKKTRMAIFTKTQEYAEAVGSAYWKALGLALWSQSAGMVAGWWYLDDFKAAFKRALVEDVHTDDGGIFRLLAALYVQSVVLEIYGLYNPRLALEYANRAVELGPQRADVYLLKAHVLKTLGRGDEAKQVLKNALEQFSSAADLGPENNIFLERIKAACLR